MGKDTIPSRDEDFDIFFKHFVTPVAANPAKYGLSATEGTAIQAALTTWSADLAAEQAAELALDAARAKRRSSRTAAEGVLRPAIRKINATASVTAADRAALGLPIHDGTRTPNPVPTTRPIGRMESNTGLRQILQWVDEETPLVKRKPDGIHGCELCLKIGDPAPVDESTTTHRVVDTATPYSYDFDPADAGKTAHWLLRWVNTRNEPGPWGPLLSAKINS